MMYIDKTGKPYFNDMQPGDREATAEEVAEVEVSRTKSEVDAKLSRVRAVREAILARVHGIKDAARDAGDTELVTACSETRFALLDITTGCPAAPELVDTFILGKYAAIVATLPESLVKAFAGGDA